MSTPFERGQKHQENALDAWQELGWSSMQEAAQAFGAEEMQTLAELQETAQREGNSERQQQVIEDNIEYYRGLLSRLD